MICKTMPNPTLPLSELQPEATIEGDVHYRMIEMALGASVNGSLVRDQEEAKGSVTPLKTVSAGDEKTI